MYVLPTVSFNGIGMQTGEATQTRKRRNRQSKTLAAGPGPAPRRAADRFRAHAHRSVWLCSVAVNEGEVSPQASRLQPARPSMQPSMHAFTFNITISGFIIVAFRRKDPQASFLFAYP